MIIAVVGFICLFCKQKSLGELDLRCELR